MASSFWHHHFAALHPSSAQPCSEPTRTTPLRRRSVQEAVKIGQSVQARVISTDLKRRQFTLSLQSDVSAQPLYPSSLAAFHARTASLHSDRSMHRLSLLVGALSLCLRQAVPWPRAVLFQAMREREQEAVRKHRGEHEAGLASMTAPGNCPYAAYSNIQFDTHRTSARTVRVLAPGYSLTRALSLPQPRSLPSSSRLASQRKAIDSSAEISGGSRRKQRLRPLSLRSRGTEARTDLGHWS